MLERGIFEAMGVRSGGKGKSEGGWESRRTVGGESEDYEGEEGLDGA